MSGARVWRVRGFELSFPPDRIMGIINCTPDSFSDAGLYLDPNNAARRYIQLAGQGADIVDLGAQSTRPGSVPISPEEELDRLLPALQIIGNRRLGLEASGKRAPLISVDTYYSSVAGKALSLGADIINDVSGLSDPAMAVLVAESGAGYILTHCEDISVCGDVCCEIRSFFARAMNICLSAGVKPEQIALDAGVGFGKTREQEIFLLDRFESLRVFDRPLLAAYSRKRVIARLMGEPDSPAASRDEATHAAHIRALRSGADFVRVHDVLGAAGSLMRK